MTPVKLHMEGDARVENPAISGLFDDNNQQLQPPGVRTDQIKVAIPLPLVARVGVAAQLASHVRGEVDVNWTRWSSFQSLDIDFVHEYYLLQTPGANLYDVHVANDWHDSWTARVRRRGRAVREPARVARRSRLRPEPDRRPSLQP